MNRLISITNNNRHEDYFFWSSDEGLILLGELMIMLVLINKYC